MVQEYKQFLIIECMCNVTGAKGIECHEKNGTCTCQKNVIGDKCDQCAIGYHGFPTCDSCCPGFTGYPDCHGMPCFHFSPGFFSYLYGFHIINGYF